MVKRRSTSPTTVLLIALAAVIVLAAVLLRSVLGGLLWRAAGPVVAWRNSLSAGQMASLEAELASTSAALADRNQLAAQNAELKLELGRAGDVREVAAAVLEHPPGTPYDTLVIDAGSAQSVALGNEVRAGGYSIGSVDEVYANTSRVVLYSAPGQSYQATLTTKTASIPVALEGQGGGSLDAKVPATTDVSVGDQLEFPGLSGGIAGAVSGVEGSATDSFKTVYVRLPVNIFQLQYVYVRI